mmetsp:Transcript_34862/g.36262  ORF Transcript_34862/g.36262 Transcript_34862/m.36262 type:complete len:540 (-) Transcript_34862:37-1656(-)
MVEMKIDDLMDFINDEKKTTNVSKPKKKNKQQNDTNPKSISNPTMDDIVTTFDQQMLIKSNEEKTNIDENKVSTDEGDIVKQLDNNDTNTGEEESKKKKHRRRKKKNKEEENEDEEDEEALAKKEKKEATIKNKEMYKALLQVDPTELTQGRFQDNSKFRVVQSWKEVSEENKVPWNQTNIPSKQIEEQFPKGDYPVGQILEYKDQTWRTNNEEKRALERLMSYDLQKLRKAAEVHRQVRKYAQKIIKPGERLIDICDRIENMNRYLINAQGIECGIGFPTGCSINHCAAHYTPNPGDFKVLGENDVCKIDFGTQVSGLIIDCAFTVAFNPEYDELLYAVQDATDTGLKEAGIDVRLGDIGAAIQEVMESYEVTIKGKTYQVKPVKNLCGHSIEAYKIHAGKSVPIVKKNDYTKMEEGELFAIETFGSTGKGWVLEDSDCSHYMKNFNYPSSWKPKSDKAKSLLNHINRNYSTLAFCRKWLANDGFAQHALPLKQLVDQDIVTPYPPLSDQEGCYVAQFEHTVMLKPNCKEIISRGDDY